MVGTNQNQTRLRKHGNSYGVFLDKRVLQKALKWDENTLLQEDYDVVNKRVIISELSEVPHKKTAVKQAGA